MTVAISTRRAPDPQVVRRATEWMARLWSGEASAADLAACEAWRAEHPDHERVWRKLQAVEQRFDSLPPTATRQALEPVPASPGRRTALKLLGLFAVTGSATLVARQTDGWALAASDHASGTGEVREIVLADGTRLVLGSASAVDVRFGPAERRVVLRTGEVFVATAHEADGPFRPFRVQTAHGEVRALGTRFTVREQDAESQVAVFEGAVEVHPWARGAGTLRLDAGQGARFSDTTVSPPAAVGETSAAWTRGVLVAERMPVAEVLAELRRYRPGVLRCDPDVADQRVTGVFSLRDTDRALASLALALPVDVVYRTRYWVTVQAR